MKKNEPDVSYSDFISSLNLYVRIEEGGAIRDTRPKRVTELLHIVREQGVSMLALYSAEDLAAMVSGHIRSNKDETALEAVPGVQGGEEILKALQEINDKNRLYGQVLSLLAQVAADKRMAHKLPLTA